MDNQIIFDSIEDLYYKWLCNKISDSNGSHNYSMLLEHLYNTIFEPMIELDENRADDGKNLRYRFGYENDIPSGIISRSLDADELCNLLEMMVALALRCEESIMANECYGDRTSIWFWDMISSLGLYTMANNNFDIKHIDVILKRFINRQYKKNGEGGLFTIDGIKKDMRTEEIWYQMCWYLDGQ